MSKESDVEDQITIHDKGEFLLGLFNAMASPCEILIDSKDQDLAKYLTEIAAQETLRIQAKYSRYDLSSQCSAINNSQGKPQPIDIETFQLLEFANHCYHLSEGLFDITSGILRQVWHFDGSDRIPSETAINKLLPCIGWQKVYYDKTQIHLPADMELDFGGIGKEYAVDKVAQLLRQTAPEISIVVNFGGDLCVTQPKPQQQSWTIGIADPATIAPNAQAAVAIKQGALATSGDAKRYLLKNGKRYCHILNPKTGWPITNAPRSITVAAPQCIMAGILATVALLQGADAEAFLAAQNIKYWCFY